MSDRAEEIRRRFESDCTCPTGGGWLCDRCNELPNDLAWALAELAVGDATLARTREALEPFGSGPTWGTIKAWMVTGAPTRTEGIALARTLTRFQAVADTALAAPPDLGDLHREQGGAYECWKGSD